MSSGPTTLGKRKERVDETLNAHGSTLFVSNLPYSATSTDIKTLFSDLGPVRSAFVVTDPTSGSSKGVGYVSFSIREDAVLAFEKVNGDTEGLVLDGRKLRAQWAESKPHKDRNEKDPTGEHTEKKAKQPKHAHTSTPRDPLAIRTIVVSGLPSSIDSKTLWKKVRKYAGAEKVHWPVQKGDEDDPTTAHVLFNNPTNAQDAIAKLHAHVYKGSLLSVTLKKRLDNLAPVKTGTAATKARSIGTTPTNDPTTPSLALPSRASRLIVRNIPFNITEQDLRSVFLPYGPIHSVHIPTSTTQEDAPGSFSRPRTKGYACKWNKSPCWDGGRDGEGQTKEEEAEERGGKNTREGEGEESEVQGQGESGRS
ncbi:hypothetical protein NLI96_g11897 [Meripilus lineatus]|uniref:RRM domain-containing protein n=1 Tax=Meripilus lineatus TaxID=2056292 RepID=A0AAD5UR11_9APHY|nr:hypothetical protein NLI96_g11897 [Physisporinus lineatus]